MSVCAVLFDMDGLLLDSERPALKNFQATCRQFGLNDFTEVYLTCIGTNLARTHEILQQAMGQVVDYPAFAQTREENYQALLAQGNVPLKPGASELLQQLQALGMPMAVATSTHRERALLKLRQTGLTGYFQTVIGGDQVTHSKPAPEIYLKAAAALNIAPADCLVLEDSANGVRAGVAAGMQVIQIPDLIQPDAQLLTLGHTVCDSLTEVPRHCTFTPANISAVDSCCH
ncbi:Phosphorylated carbohydrates phosphatase [Vibrio aerogenes CECT 7868]|uniref:Phosphorylated carbohydrates phosphatase n=1 Tax=Vibrio aerogenes CECT 7868 TaxID=1216006 RepID=A0A1M5Z4W7_9VIBR|nr:HAD family phosphatase [Vibrio aerogenes]SHI19317.1 Phosphorylated carbohydrates phosphatase [Vibrio aerogenes CECT 7868]